MSILYVGIDPANNVSAVHGMNALGVAELRQPKVARAKLLTLIASLPPCVIGMEAWKPPRCTTSGLARVRKLGPVFS